jgi:hypothetical protein
LPWAMRVCYQYYDTIKVFITDLLYGCVITHVSKKKKIYTTQSEIPKYIKLPVCQVDWKCNGFISFVYNILSRKYNYNS